MIIGNGNILKPSLSDFDALITLDIKDAKVFEEIMYSVSKRLNIPASPATLDIVIDPTLCTCAFFVFLPIIFKAFGAGPIHIDVYFGTDADNDGTILESGNRDLTSINTSNVIVRLNPTINNVGTKLPFEFTVLSDGVAATANVGGESKEGEVFNARLDGKYLFRLSNQDANPTTGAHISFSWYEVP